MKNSIISAGLNSRFYYGLVLLAIAGLASCSASRNTSRNNQDDVYFSASDAKAEREANRRTNVSNAPDYTPPAQSQNDNTQQGGQDYSNGTGTQPTQVTNNYYGDSFDYDDYYDYSYSSRIRRFHRPYNGFGYYDPIYTNVYYYDYDPFFWGNSIYLGYNWWAPAPASYVSWNSGWGMGYGLGWYRPWYRPWVYSNSWYYGSVWGGWWNNPWSYNSWGWGGYGGWGGWGNPYTPAFGWGCGWGNPYWSGYSHGFNNGYWAGYQHGLYRGAWDNLYYNSFDQNTYYYGPRNSASATGSGGRGSFASNFEQAQAVDKGKFNRFSPANQVGGITNGVRPSGQVKPMDAVQTARPNVGNGVSAPTNPVVSRPAVTGTGAGQIPNSGSLNQDRPGGVSTIGGSGAINPGLSGVSQVKDRPVQGGSLSGHARPVSPEWVRPSVPGNVSPQTRPATGNVSTGATYSRPSSEVYTRPQTPSGNFNSNAPSNPGRPERPSGNFNNNTPSQTIQPSAPANRPAPANDYYSRPSRQDRPTQNYSTPRSEFNSGVTPSGNYRPSNRDVNQPSRPSMDFSNPSNSRPGSDYSKPQPSRPSMDAPRPSNRGSYQAPAPSGGGLRSGGSVSPSRSGSSGGGLGGGRSVSPSRPSSSGGGRR